MSEYNFGSEFFDEADSLGGGSAIFPAGVFKGKIKGTSLAEEHPHVENEAPWDDTLKRLRFSLQENEVLDGDDPGEQWMFVDLTLEIGGYDFQNMPDKGTGEYFALASAIVKMGDLAVQLGLTGDHTTFDADEFVKLMVDGKFTDAEVVFETFHKASKKDDRVFCNLTPRAFVGQGEV